MLNKRVKKYIVNPCLGLTPLLIYLISFGITRKVEMSLIISLFFAVAASLLLRMYSKVSKMGIVFLISFVALAITLVFWLASNHLPLEISVYLILPEILIVVFLMVIRMAKVYLVLRFFKDENVLQKAFVNEFFDIAIYIQYLFTLHVFSVTLYGYLSGNNAHMDNNNPIIFVWIPAVVIVLLLVYEDLKLSEIIKKLKKEEWLPIVNEQGEVKGKIARSVSQKMRNKFLHPVVRVALVHKGKIYLQERKSTQIVDPKRIDHPFEKYMLFNHEINLAVRNSIVQTLGKELPFKFLLKYTFENEKTKRLMFLFVAHIEDESEIGNISNLHGKFWTTKQIEDDFGDTSNFSECFQLEYEYLKNTVLAVDQMMNKPK